MHNDEITVVCPTYNSSHYINRAIQSILSQEDPPSEVVFSDDGSKDETVSIIEKNRSKFEKLNIDLIILQNIRIIISVTLLALYNYHLLLFFY